MKNCKKIILITGATGGIGKAIALLLAQQKGYCILAIDRNSRKLKALQKNITSCGGICYLYKTDLAQYTELKKLYKNIYEKFKTIDWIVHSSGYIDIKETFSSKISTPLIQNTFAVNTFSPIYLTQQFLKHIKRDGGVIYISSTAGIHGNDKFPIYSASKGALNNYSEALAKYLAAKKISSIVVCPGPTNTPMREKVAHDASDQQSPYTIASVIQKIIGRKSVYKNGDIIIVRNKKKSLYKFPSYY